MRKKQKINEHQWTNETFKLYKQSRVTADKRGRSSGGCPGSILGENNSMDVGGLEKLMQYVAQEKLSCDIWIVQGSQTKSYETMRGFFFGLR